MYLYTYMYRKTIMCDPYEYRMCFHWKIGGGAAAKIIEERHVQSEMKGKGMQKDS